MADENDPNFKFGWQTFPEGRVRFGGLERGADERGHESLVIDFDGAQSFGEIDLDPAADRTHYGLIVRSMGWNSAVMLGEPPDSRRMRAFSSAQVQRIERLIAQLVAEFAERDSRPAFFFTPQSSFTGSLRFADGWCLISNESMSNG